MKYYAYGTGSPNWREDKKDELVKALRLGLNLPAERRENAIWISAHGSKFAQVRIMGIECLTWAEEEKIIESADEIYDQVMGIKSG